MTAPEPSGCAITGDARTAFALLAADPPEIGVVRTEMANAHASGAMGMYLGLDQVAELLASVDYLRDERDRLRSALNAEADRHAGIHWCCDHGACDVHERGDCGARRRILGSARPPGGEG